ncbi:MAG: hypothetical protein QOI63_1780 [Thermoplasmata archaeon]|nr:hypothetical protein [Thermoplasmata archaeon]
MRWLLVLVGVLLLAWLASGDARAWTPPPAQDIWAARLASPAPGVVGAWVTLAPDACGAHRLLEAHFLYDGRAYAVRAPLPPCPSPPLFLGLPVPPLPAGTPAEASDAYVMELGLGAPPDGYVQRYPDGGFLPAQALGGRPGPAQAVALAAADVAVVGGVWAVAAWRDPTARSPRQG